MDYVYVVFHKDCFKGKWNHWESVVVSLSEAKRLYVRDGWRVERVDVEPWLYELWMSVGWGQRELLTEDILRLGSNRVEIRFDNVH